MIPPAPVAGVEQDHPKASQSREATPSKATRYLDGKPASRDDGRRRHRLERVRRDAEGLAALEGEPVDPTEPSAPPTAVTSMSFSWLLVDSRLRQAVFDQWRPQPILPAGARHPPKVALTGQSGGAIPRLGHFESFRDTPTVTCP